MAQKITGYVKLQIPAGKATPAQVGETDPVSPKAVSGIGRPLPHFYEGGASLWHRKSLVM